MASELIALLRRLGLTLATAESLTGGLVSAAITEVPGASTVFRGGVVTYQTSMKQAILGLDPIVIEEHTVVSSEVVQAMAEAVLALHAVDVAISTTGVAGPDELDGHQVGEVWIACATRSGGTHAERLLLAGSRSEIRKQSVKAALDFAHATVSRGLVG